jgi:hypothetical protein
VSSVSIQDFGLEDAAAFSRRIVVGTLLEKSAFRFPGSPEHAPTPEGEPLAFFRLRVEKTLKGPPFKDGEELRVFSSSQWFQHTHRAQIRGGVISYAELSYSGGLPDDGLQVGTRLLTFLHGDPAPSGFPPGSVFLSMNQACERAEREDEVARALRERPPADFGERVILTKTRRPRFPDGLEIRLLGHSHKRPMIDGPRKEWIDIEVSAYGRKERLSLAHDIEPDGKESWETRPWQGYAFEVTDMNSEEATIIVRTT